MQYIKSRNLWSKEHSLGGCAVTIGNTIIGNGGYTGFYIPVAPNTDYTIQLFNDTGSIYCAFADGNVIGSNIIGNYFNTYSNWNPLVKNSGSAKYLIVTRWTSSMPKDFAVMVNKGSTALPYEPYMLPFKVLKRSRNLIPYPYFYYDQGNKIMWNFPYTVGGITFTESNGIITANGTATKDIWWRFAEKIPFNTGDKFSVSGMTTIGSTRTFRVYATLYDAETKKEFASIIDYGNGATINTISVSGSINCYIVISSGATLYNVQFKPMLNKGEIIPYEPYIQQCDIQCPINIINYDELLYSDIFVRNDDDTYTLKKTENGRFSKDSKINSKAGTYIYSFELIDSNINPPNVETNYSYKLLLLVYGKDGESVERILSDNTTKIYTIPFDIVRINLCIFWGHPLGSYITFKNLKLIRIGD